MSTKQDAAFDELEVMVNRVYNHAAGYADVVERIADLMRDLAGDRAGTADALTEVTRHFRKLLGIQKGVCPFPEVKT